MRRQVALLSLALFATTPALAQQQSSPVPQPRPGGPAAMGAPGMMRGPGMTGMMGGPGMTGMMGGPGMMGMMGGPGMMGMMGGGMMGMGGMMMAPEHIEGRLAFLKTELEITDAQMAAWNAFADALRANAKAMAATRATMMQTMHQGAGTTAPQMLELHEKHLAQHLEAVKRTRATLEPLYAALSDQQKKTADELLGHAMM